MKKMSKLTFNPEGYYTYIISLLIKLFFINSLIIAGCAKKEVRVLPTVTPKSLTYQEGSIWPREADDLFLFNDPKAKSIGDTLTVHIVENVKAANNATTKTSRESDNKINMNFGGQSNKYIMGGGNKFTGGGATTRSGSLKTTLTALVVDVFPNGNLVIDGMKELNVNDDKQTVKITGIVRPKDISRNNSVLSTNIAEVKITYNGEGTLALNQSPRYVGRFLNFIWPF